MKMFKVGDVGVVEMWDGRKDKATVIAVYNYFDGMKIVVLVYGVFDWVVDNINMDGKKFDKDGNCYLTFTKSE